MPTISEALMLASSQLRNSSVPNDLLDAQTLLAHALGKDRTYLIINFNQTLSDEVLKQFQNYIDRRSTREPLQYIVGKQEFFGLDFEVTPDVLIPRPETELIVEETIRLAASLSHPIVIDVGTGSGCIAVSVARELSKAQVVATDISSKALTVAARNAKRNGVEDQIKFVAGDLFQEIPPNLKADFILSNPPYIAASEMPGLQLEVRDWEPKVALTDFGDGLQFYRRLLAEAPDYLQSNGVLIFELGYQQSEQIKALVDRHIWNDPRALQDFQGIDRTMVLSRR
ncbi:MAG: peptide chain release factor N(5)-glutamine methyltransferase [Acidobacteria bacterium]|nr:peptide chain release factor N(5)-glutamine methyltransferase [Acidobacteriota bacterium]